MLCHNDTFPLSVLIDGSDLLAMDEGGTSDPYCKFKWAPTELLVLNLKLPDGDDVVFQF